MSDDHSFTAHGQRRRSESLRLGRENRATFDFLEESDRFRVTIQRLTSSATHDVQLNLAGYAVSANAEYRVTFSGRADAERTLSLGFSKANAPWSNAGLYRSLRLTTDWAEFSADFVATLDETDARIHFDIGNSPIAVELSSVSLWQATENGVVLLPRRESGAAWRGLDRSSPPPVGTPIAGFSSWVASVPNPESPRSLGYFRMFAVLGTWMEADIVAATVHNAMLQGCECVYVVDNGSTDGTQEAAVRAGAVIARSYASDRYDEDLRLRHMNDVVAEVSQTEGDSHIWWLFLDADEFPHGPWGMTLREYLATLDEKFRVVGTRFFNHYPGDGPSYEPDRHPIDFQPLCEELAFPMCPSRHRKHPLLRFDRDGPRIESAKGFHTAYCDEQLYEPSQPAFLHHFPFRDKDLTRRRLEALWTKDPTGTTRATEWHDTHMLARFRSLDAVYAQNWSRVENFVSLDPINEIVNAPASGVAPRPWAEMVEPEHQHVKRWYDTPMVGVWKYASTGKFHYGDDVTYRRGIAFLDGRGTIEDWGCGFAHARSFVTESAYVGVDGSSQWADKIRDLREYRSDADCIFMRHVLEHNVDWRPILANAVNSFRRRMVLIVFTPFSDSTRIIATSQTVTSVPVPDISFRKEDLTAYFSHLKQAEEMVETETQYGIEHLFYIEKPDDEPAIDSLQRELEAWSAADLTPRFWWRDDDAVTDTLQLRRLLRIAEELAIVPAIAVVPEQADESLAALLSEADCCVWQHGWGHHTQTAGEFGEGRAADTMALEASAGQRILDRLFGPHGWQRVFVPPFHLLSMRFKALVPDLGYLGVSAGVQLTPPIDHVVEVNAEVDVMNWPERRMLGDLAIRGRVAEQLADRRTENTDPTSPIGILTHHLVFVEEDWTRLTELFRFLQSRGAEFPKPAGLFPSPATVAPAAAREPAGVTVVITSCGRQDLLERTLDSFIKYNSCPVAAILVMEDGQPETNRRLAARYSDVDIQWLSTGERIGQIPAIDAAYRHVDTEFIFHCEDDWEFTAPGFIEKSLAILEANPAILQVWIRSLTDTNQHPVLSHCLFAGDVPYRVMQPGHHTEEWGTWNGFSFNPGLRRRSDYLAIAPLASFNRGEEKLAYETERDLSAFYLDRGLLAAILADNDGMGYVRHIGSGRRIEKPA
ncbi:glycosyltransferase [Bauldia litoralis]|uniref:Carbohydrate binding domain-containing protein n=1 Tax=Bauldia litoralis TaxID=665467 RepID=A0A1G6E9Q6_9HYPH|nr:glycosyltransferase [Bauldia litoralis]SDB54187.1 Carbohydrate binding domain-containing protein [Bauldia litoralis]